MIHVMLRNFLELIVFKIRIKNKILLIINNLKFNTKLFHVQNLTYVFLIFIIRTTFSFRLFFNHCRFSTNFPLIPCHFE